jgi:hypothetical protein
MLSPLTGLIFFKLPCWLCFFIMYHFRHSPFTHIQGVMSLFRELECFTKLKALFFFFSGDAVCYFYCRCSCAKPNLNVGFHFRVVHLLSIVKSKTAWRKTDIANKLAFLTQARHRVVHKAVCQGARCLSLKFYNDCTSASSIQGRGHAALSSYMCFTKSVINSATDL